MTSRRSSAPTWPPPAASHSAALRPGQLPHDVEAEPDAAEPAPVTRLALHETLEDAFVIARCDADPLVIDGDLDPLPGRPRPYRDRPAAGRVLEGVLQQLA